MVKANTMFYSGAKPHDLGSLTHQQSVRLSRPAPASTKDNTKHVSTCTKSASALQSLCARTGWEPVGTPEGASACHIYSCALCHHATRDTHQDGIYRQSGGLLGWWTITCWWSLFQASLVFLGLSVFFSYPRIRDFPGSVFPHEIGNFDPDPWHASGLPQLSRNILVSIQGSTHQAWVDLRCNQTSVLQCLIQWKALGSACLVKVGCMLGDIHKYLLMPVLIHFWVQMHRVEVIVSPFFTHTLILGTYWPGFKIMLEMIGIRANGPIGEGQSRSLAMLYVSWLIAPAFSVTWSLALPYL